MRVSSADWFKAGVARQRADPISLGIASRACTILSELLLLSASSSSSSSPHPPRQNEPRVQMMMTFITGRGEGQGKTKKERKATKSKGRGLEEGASRALMRKHGEGGCGERG